MIFKELNMPTNVISKTKDFFSERISWQETGDAEFPYRTIFEGDKLQIRVNDFPDKPLYTLIINGMEEADYEDWSPSWRKTRSA
jgi:hypothetical protein